MKRADGSKGTSESKERSGEVRFDVGVIGVDATCPPATGKVSGGRARRSLDSSLFVRFHPRGGVAVNIASAPVKGPQGGQQRSGHMSRNERTPGPCGGDTKEGGS